MVYIGFDFSINKPACTVVDVSSSGSVTYKHYCWPSKASKNAINILENAGVVVIKQDLDVSNGTYSGDMVTDIKNAKKLADLICNTLSIYLNGDKDVYIAQEGFSYGSKGSSILDLAGYKYILMDYINKHVSFDNMLTYAPATIKKTAGCSKKNKNKKDDMIEAFKDEENLNTRFRLLLNEYPQQLKMKTNYVVCVDDIVDSYWVTKTMLNDLDVKL
ncbi:MAG: hypothetical protein ACRDD8_15040 [Bacteroidales bacterium]